MHLTKGSGTRDPGAVHSRAWHAACPDDESRVTPLDCSGAHSVLMRGPVAPPPPIGSCDRWRMQSAQSARSLGSIDLLVWAIGWDVVWQYALGVRLVLWGARSSSDVARIRIRLRGGGGDAREASRGVLRICVTAQGAAAAAEFASLPFSGSGWCMGSCMV
eukprot:CAMPEP_0181186296 /NCGR_PEP_ID=MMETSP1096-20121128/9959_1 /TAXON_ID=156174 ORGANISM="Chrysochromulina ericina, Strain CCMP281" /NCGR_SAMPLE_ID=MMETSP1096 /ASSEMBLY_ACC=CAM_ASM_000453 /LENGTH=160 /DNA_ID=CAMNT_0023275185 /DNA_START=208 /DNA_END=686 /DNA_ORIENTATION=+